MALSPVCRVAIPVAEERRDATEVGTVVEAKRSATATGTVALQWLRQRKTLYRAEVGIGLVLTLAAVYLHTVFRFHAGGLWRDEVNTVQLARLPSFAQIWDNLQFDSFPILIFSVVRTWTALFSDSDAALRTYGLLVGAGILGALWLNARLFGHRVPLLAVALLGCNPLFIRYADSLRAYGLGMLLMLLTFGAVWRVVEKLRPGRVAVAAILAVLSVQTLYYNSVLLLSMCLAGAITAGCERDWKKVFCVLGIGAPAALSILPYAGTIERLHEWNFLVQFPVALPLLWKTLSNVLGSPDPLAVWLWSLLVVGALVLLGWHIRGLAAVRAGAVTPGQRVLRYAGGTLVIGTVCYGLFLKALSYYMLPWYYVAYLALAAVSLDAIYGAAFRSGPLHAPRWRVARLGLVWGFCALVLMQARAELFTRQTDLDLVAGEVSTAAVPGDLVVNVRWECAITFEHYYHGPAPDMTLPPIADHRFHRYDLVLEQMRTKDAVQPVLDKVESTLRAGHRVWLVGEPIIPGEGVKIPTLGAHSQGARAQQGNIYYYEVWAMQVSELLYEHVNTATRIQVPAATPVSEFENLPVSVFSGWR